MAQVRRLEPAIDAAYGGEGPTNWPPTIATLASSDDEGTASNGRERASTLHPPGAWSMPVGVITDADALEVPVPSRAGGVGVCRRQGGFPGMSRASALVVMLADLSVVCESLETNSWEPGAQCE